MLRIYGSFQQIDDENRDDLGGSPETWSGSRIDDQIKEGLHILVDDRYFEAEGVLEFDGDGWYARIVEGTVKKKPTKPK